LGAGVKTNIYVDGFNLYYDSLKHTLYRWLDISTLCKIVLPNNTINRIRYFTALVKPRPNNPQQLQRQQIYLRALETISNLSIHYGHYLSSTVRMPLAHPLTLGPRTVEVIKTEEKGSDVNIATHMLLDAFEKDCEAIVLLSNDSDLALPVTLIRQKFNIPVGLLNPQKIPSVKLRTVASFYRPIRQGALAASQFPSQLIDAQGQITKSAS
jgi:uncharacterized LabA/DUF88 family protein